MQLTVGWLSPALQLEGNGLIGRLDAPGSLPQATVEMSVFSEPLLLSCFILDVEESQTELIMTVAVTDGCFGHQGEGKKLRVGKVTNFKNLSDTWILSRIKFSFKLISRH